MGSTQPNALMVDMIRRTYGSHGKLIAICGARNRTERVRRGIGGNGTQTGQKRRGRVPVHRTTQRLPRSKICLRRAHVFWYELQECQSEG